jgi:lycopene beta-cyclase
VQPISDVLVVGGGPAGHAAAAACAQAGMTTTLLTPDPGAAWTQTYGAWHDELADVELTDVTARRWHDVLVRTTGRRTRRLDRTYCLVDNERLHDVLWTRAAAAGARRVRGRGSALRVRADHVEVTTADGVRHRGRAVVDASGQPPAFAGGATTGRRASRAHGATLAYQTAYGLIATFDRPPAPPGAVCLMDFDATPFVGEEPATFLYAMDLGADRWLVEETCLARRPALPIRTLSSRLRRRLEARGAVPVEVHATERVAFPMDAPPPYARRDDVPPITAFGAAAALVHPATGYQVATALRRAPRLATALRTALDGPSDPMAVAAAGTAAVWPTDQRRQHALYRVGLEVLLRLDVAATQRFFAAFFELPPAAWQGYVSWRSSPAQLQVTMARLLRELPTDVRGEVLRAVVRRPALRWLAAAVAPATISR